MQIREINIDGFGIFSNKKVTGLTSGLNVIYGENEAGKTTLIEFIRRLLFEVSKRAKGFNPYLPLNGTRHGGSLKCQSASGENIFISRNLEGKGEVFLSTSTSELRGQSALDSILGHATPTLFQNIFAFTLDELQTFDSLNENEIKNRIYGAELGLGAVSLKQVEDSLNKRADSIFLPRGKKTETNVLLNEIQDIEQQIRFIQRESGEYDLLMRQLESCEKEQETLSRQIESLEVQIRNLNTWIDLSKALEEEEIHLHDLRIEHDSLKVNQDLLKHEADILSLQQSTQAVNTSLTDKENLQRDKVLLEEKIHSDLHEIGSHWDEEQVRNFEFNPARTTQIESFARALENLRLEMSKAQDRLDLHREQKAGERSKGWNIPPWWKTIAFALSGLGIAGLLWSLIELNIPLLVAAILSLGVGLFIFLKTWREGKDFAREDLLEKTLTEKWQQAQSAYDQKKSEWCAWLKKMSFDETLEPLSAQEFGNSLRQIKERITRKAELERRIGDMLKLEQEINNRIIKIKPYLRENSLQEDILTNIRIISELFAQAKDNQINKNQIEKQIQQQSYKVGKLKSNLKELEPFLVPEVRNEEESSSGHPSFTNLNSVNEELVLATNRLKELENEKGRMHETIGETRSKLERLTSNEELLIKQEILEIKKQNLRENVQEWFRTKIALSMLDAARKQYEKTRQPGVIKAAEKIFSGITGEKYPHIIKGIEDDEIRIENENSDRRTVSQMSRGTREQLYLSMRLGLIEEYETRSEPLPIIMDDVLVNFDDRRKSNVIEVLKQFAQNRQIILLTCHKSSLESYAKAGANQILV